MKHVTIYSLGLLLLLGACKSNETAEKSTKDTLTYSYDSLKKVSPIKAKNYLDIEDSTYVRIVYPKFQNTILNESIQKQLTAVFGPEVPANSITELATNFINGYENFRKETPDRPQTWYLDIQSKVLYQNSNYLAIEVRSEEYAGGAHGNLFIKYLNYNPKTNAPLILDDFLLPNSYGELLKIAEKQFRKNEGLTETQALSGYFFENEKFSLAANYRLTSEGIEFIYNNYEIKPYSDGTTLLTIPYSAIDHLLKQIYKSQSNK